MKERIERLRGLRLAFDTIPQRQFFVELLDILSDLSHKVEEFEPEEITIEDVNAYYDEKYRNAVLDSKQRLKQGEERDKIAKELVEVILRDEGLVGPTIIKLATQLQVKLNATTK